MSRIVFPSALSVSGAAGEHARVGVHGQSGGDVLLDRLDGFLETLRERNELPGDRLARISGGPSTVAT